jgi:hypothetical protein
MLFMKVGEYEGKLLYVLLIVQYSLLNPSGQFMYHQV